MYYLIQDTKTGRYYMDISGAEVRFTDYRPHAAFYSNRKDARGMAEYLKRRGYRVKVV